MEAAVKLGGLSVEDYLSGEALSQMRHEYVGGMLYAMAGASEEHNLISLNLATALRWHLRGKPCRVFMVDMKVRLQIAQEDVFYYPDLMVACDPRDTERYFKRFPRVLIEVLSEETERTDRREKLASYQQIETLEEYLLVAQDRVEATLFARKLQWRPEILRAENQALRLGSIGFEMPLRAVYEGVSVG